MKIPDIFLRSGYGKTQYSIFTPVSVINYQNFRELMMGDISNLSEVFSEFHKEISHNMKYQWGNTHYRFSNIYGTEFSFQLYGQELTVWDYQGSTSICHATLEDDLEQRLQTINDILKISEKWSVGEIRCSDCQKWMNFEENHTHRYFAGVYCLDCWERKWKAIEAKENYE